MTTTIGRVDYLVDLDGKTVPIQARKIGAQIGQSMGKSADSEFQKSLDGYGKQWAARMSKNGKLAGTSFGDAMNDSLRGKFDRLTRDMADVFSSKNGIDDFVKNFDDAGVGVDELRGNLERLRKEVIAYVDDSGEIQTRNVLNERSYIALNKQLDDYSKKLNHAANVDLAKMIELGEIWDKELREENQTLGEQKGRLSALSTEIQMMDVQRQKDSALRDEQLRIGKLWAKEIDNENKLTAESSDILDRNASSHDKNTSSVGKHASAWKNLSANTRQWTLIVAAIAASAGEIATLGSVAGSSITVLAGSLLELGVAGGVAITGFSLLAKDLEDLTGNAAAAKVGILSFSETFKGLRDLIGERMFVGAQEAFFDLSATIIGLKEPILLVADAISRFVTAFAGSIAEGTTGFANWSAIIAAAAPFLDSFGSALIQLGTALGTIFVAALPSIQSFADFLNTIFTQFSAWLSSTAGQTALTEFFGTLNTLAGPLVDLIAATGKALASLVTPQTIQFTVDLLNNLTQFMPALSGILGVLANLDVFGLLAQLLNAIGQILTPLIPVLTQAAFVIGDTLAYAIGVLVPPLTNLLASIAPLIPTIVELAASLFLALLPAVIPIIDAITQLIPLFFPLIEAIIPLIPSIVQLALVIGTQLAQTILAIAPLLTTLIELTLNFLTAVTPLIPLISLFVSGALFAFNAILNVIVGVLGLVVQAVNAIFAPVAEMARQVGIGTDSFDALSGMVDSSIDTFNDWASAIGDAISGVLDWIGDAIDAFARLFGASSKAGNTSGNSGGGGGGMATGGIVTYGARRLIGEDGPEAVVPLSRNLNDVDPSVRALSAFAQGLPYSGGLQQAGRQVTVLPGAVVVQEAGNGTQTAHAVVDRMVTKL